MFSKLNKRHYFFIGVGILALVSIGGFAYYQLSYLPSQTQDAPEIQTTTVRRGDLVIYASGSGKLIALNEIELGFGTSGPVSELNVQAGDEVQAGDVLAVQGDREQLEASVAADQLSVINAQNALDDLYENADVVAAQAQLDLANAKDQLRSAEFTWTVQQEGNRASDLTLAAADAELAIAEEAVERAKHQWDMNPNSASAKLGYISAQQKYESALRNWNWYTGHPTEIQQALLDAEVAIAEAGVAQAERQWQEVKNGPDPDEVEMAELQLANAEAKLAVSQRNLDESTIVAPVNGTILSVSAKAGQNVSGVFITMADLSQLYMEIYLDETDMDKIEVDYEVEVMFDALPDLVFTGNVVQVEPSLYTSGMISAIKGLVELDEGATPGNDNLLIGMNASVDVIAGRAEGVALVPVEALHELSPGEYAVFVMEGGELKLRFVEVGLSDLTFAEIKSGLEVGEVVSTGIVETQ
jgi:HlyD family secretion protein